jgi:hypothetical protein
MTFVNPKLKLFCQTQLSKSWNQTGGHNLSYDKIEVEQPLTASSSKVYQHQTVWDFQVTV